MSAPSQDGALDRFVSAQEGVYGEALAELLAGDKRSHWMWFVFPQIAGLGHSPTARHYAIADLDEARAYLAHDRLGPRLAECTSRDAQLGGKDAAPKPILGGIDAMKFRSSMTLFEAAALESAGGEDFSRALDAFYGGARDAATLRLLAR